MKMMNMILLAEEASNKTSDNTSASNNGVGSSEQLTNALKGMVTSPWFYIVIGVIVLAIIVFYLYRRMIRARANSKTIIIKKGSIYKILDENNPKHFLVPFVEKVGAVISMGERELTSDKLFINNGPDFLYQINFTLTYKVTDAEKFYPFNQKHEEMILKKINENLREFADKGNALVLVKDYREHNEDILRLVNDSIKDLFVEAVSFKINLIQPLGGR